jgi:hypothetical protein
VEHELLKQQSFDIDNLKYCQSFDDHFLSLEFVIDVIERVRIVQVNVVEQQHKERPYQNKHSFVLLDRHRVNTDRTLKNKCDNDNDNE